MDQRQLRDLSVSAIGLGCMGMSGLTAPLLRKRKLSSCSSGRQGSVCTFWDTSDIYGPFTNETCWSPRHSRGGASRSRWRPNFGNESRRGRNWVGINGRPDYVRLGATPPSSARRRLHRSLLSASRGPEMPIEETVGAMAGLVEAGKVRHIGSPKRPPKPSAGARGAPGSALQSEYSALDPRHRSQILPTIGALGDRLRRVSPLGGFLTGACRSAADLPRTTPLRRLPGRGGDCDGDLTLIDGSASSPTEGLHADQSPSPGVMTDRPDVMPICRTERVEVPQGDLAPPMSTSTPTTLPGSIPTSADATGRATATWTWAPSTADRPRAAPPSGP